METEQNDTEDGSDVGEDESGLDIDDGEEVILNSKNQNDDKEFVVKKQG